MTLTFDIACPRDGRESLIAKAAKVKAPAPRKPWKPLGAVKPGTATAAKLHESILKRLAVA